MLRLAAAALAMMVSTPAFAADWYFVASADDHANISFIDKDSIEQTGSTMHAAMFSLLAEVDGNGASAYRFVIEIDCQARTSRLVAAEIYDEDHKPLGENPMETEWAPIQPDTQGEIISNFVCSRGKLTAETPGVGKALPFEAGRKMLAERARGGR